MFENETQVKVMWGGLQDAANLWYSFQIKVECMLDLQGKFSTSKFISKLSAFRAKNLFQLSNSTIGRNWRSMHFTRTT